LEAGNEDEMHIDVSSFLPISLDMRQTFKSNKPAHWLQLAAALTLRYVTNAFSTPLPPPPPTPPSKTVVLSQVGGSQQPTQTAFKHTRLHIFLQLWLSANGTALQLHFSTRRNQSWTEEM